MPLNRRFAFSVALAIALLLFLIGSTLVMLDPLMRVYIEKFQTLVTGVLAILAAGVAYYGAVQAARIQARGAYAQARASADAARRQIGHQRDLEIERQKHERQTIEKSLNAELLAYSRSLIEATSQWNRKARGSAVPLILPKFAHPVVFESIVSKMGQLKDVGQVAILTSFYSNLLEVNEMATEPRHGPRTVGQTDATISARLQQMSYNLALALEEFNPGTDLSIQPDIDALPLMSPAGKIIGDDTKAPKNLQELLRMLAGDDL